MVFDPAGQRAQRLVFYLRFIQNPHRLVGSEAVHDLLDYFPPGTAEGGMDSNQLHAGVRDVGMGVHDPARRELAQLPHMPDEQNSGKAELDSIIQRLTDKV